MKFPVIIVHTTSDSSQTYLTARTQTEYDGVLTKIMENPQTAFYQLFEHTLTVTRSIVWDAVATDQEMVGG
jgi:hypothetical protein